MVLEDWQMTNVVQIDREGTFYCMKRFRAYGGEGGIG
jgi:hypothetical protein